jgi:hypothetical protein
VKERDMKTPRRGCIRWLVAGRSESWMREVGRPRRRRREASGSQSPHSSDEAP